MLYLDDPIGPIHGFLLYKDHADSGLYYYVRERPRLAMADGAPELVFLKYRRDVTDNPAFDADTKQELGGGFLAFTVDLGADDAELDALRQEVASQAGVGGDVRLTPVQFDKGSCRLTITKDAADAVGSKPDQPRGIDFFEEVYGATKPSLFGFNRATFSILLSQEGATLMEAALRAGLSPIGVIYDLSFLGLRPAFDVKITADYHRVYSDLEIQFGIRGQIGPVSIGAEIDAAFQKLKDDGSVKVEVLSFTDDQNLRHQADAAFDWFKTELLRDFFKTAIEPPSFMRQGAAPGVGGAPGIGGLPGAGGTVGGIPGLGGTTTAPGAGGTVPGGGVRPPGTTAPGAGTLPGGVRPPMPPVPGAGAQPPVPGAPRPPAPPAPPVPGATSPAGAPAPTGGTTTTATAPAPAPSAVTTPPPAPAPRPASPSAPAAPAPGGARPPAGAPGAAPGAGAAGAGGKSPSPFQVGFTLKYVNQEELKTREFEYSEQAAVEREAAPQGLLSTVVQGIDLDRAIQEVSLDDDFFKRLVATVSIAGDLAKEGVNAVTVNLEYPGKLAAGKDPDHVDGFLFKPPDQLAPHTFTNWLNAAKDLSYRYQVDVHFNADSPWQGKSTEVTSDWQTTRNRQLTIDPLDEIGLFDVTIALGSVDDKQLSQVQVEMWYQDEANGFESQQTFALSPGQPPAHWKLRLSDPSLRTYRYRTTYVFQDHLRYQTGWQSSEDLGLVINNPYQSALKVRLVPLLDAANLVEADVNVTYKEPDTGFERSVQTTFSGSPLAAQPVVIPVLAAEPAGYAYDVTVVRQDGSVFESGPMTATGGTGVVVVSDGAGSTHRIRVKLLDANLTAAGLAALKVFLEGPGDQPDTAEALFTPSQAADQTLALVQPDAGGAFVYKYRVVGYTLAGQPVQGDSGTASDLSFLVRLPRP